MDFQGSHHGLSSNEVPEPTQMFRGEGVTGDSVSESYWKAREEQSLHELRDFIRVCVHLANLP